MKSGLPVMILRRISGIFREGIHQVEEIESEEGTSWNKVHLPGSFSVGCNLEGVETVHLSSKDPEELTAKLVGTLLEMAKKRYEACVERFEYIFEQLEQLKVQEMVSLQEDMVDGGVSSTHMKSLENLFKKFEDYCKELAVFGFNSAGYDIKLKKNICLKNCVNTDSNLISPSKRLERIHASKLNI